VKGKLEALATGRAWEVAVRQNAASALLGRDASDEAVILTVIEDGEPQVDVNIVTARDLVGVYVRYRHLIAAKDEWTADAVNRNPPRFARLVQIEEMRGLFNICGDTDSLETGEFIALRPVSYYEHLAATRDARLQALAGLSMEALRRKYVELIEQRQDLETALNRFKCVFVAETETIREYERRRRGSAPVIQAEAAVMDSLLAAIIDPYLTCFEKDVLEKQYAHIAWNLAEIDDYWM